MGNSKCPSHYTISVTRDGKGSGAYYKPEEIVGYQACCQSYLDAHKVERRTLFFFIFFYLEAGFVDPVKENIRTDTVESKH